MRHLKKDTEVNYKSMVFVLVVGVMIGLTGCGGGGGSSTPPSSDTQTGYLIDSAVDGVEYITSSGKSGTTSDGGKFEYANGDTNISFSIGGLKLPDFNLSNLNSDSKILPTDLVGVDRNNTTDGNVTKLLQILQSLDSDGDPSNGITINQATRALFVATTRIIDTNISTLTTLFTSKGKGMRSVAEARAHFESTLRGSGFGFDVDTVAPNTPTLTTNVSTTETNTTQIEVNGEAGAKIFVNGIDINLTIDTNGTKTITLDTNATVDNNNTFIIVLKDSKDNQSDSYTITITKKAPPPTTELYIRSAIYDTNRTATPNDDKLYLYFNKDLKPSSISSDSSSNYDINGTGAIGSSSLSEYNSSLFYRHKISLNSDGTASQKFDTNGSTKIYLKNNQITDISDNLPQDFNQTEVKKFNALGRLRTGQTTTYVEHDDGNTTRGIARSFTNNGDDTVTDNATGLMWQDDAAVKTNDQNQTDAIIYCENLNFAGYTDWYLPSVEELVSITDKERTNPTIDPTFTNVVSSRYWSSTTYVSNTSVAWAVYFYRGDDSTYTNTYEHYVRCVRASY
jgi:hypothetical protein